MNEFICDDRNQIEKLREVNSMTDEEFAEYIASINKDKDKEKSD